MNKTSTYIPDSVYKSLPSIFNGVFDNLGVRERDVVFLSSLTSLSACFPRVSFKRNDGKVYFPNLNCLIVAPSASNKSYSIHGKQIIKTLLNQLNSASKNHSAKSNEIREALESYPDINENFLIPGNNSYAGIIHCLNRNNGIGIIHESEADVIGDNLSKEWGDYSTLIRNSFEHETISCYRIKDKKTTTIENPKLSIHLTGTPDQVSKLIPNTDNGLFSRFIYYTYENDLNWRNPFAPNYEPLTLNDKMVQLSSNTLGYIANRLQSDLEFHLSEANLIKMDKFYTEIIDKLKRSQTDLDTSFLLRSTTNLLRIGSILSIFRTERKETSEAIINSTDFDSALSIIKVSFDHSILMMKKIQKCKMFNKKEAELIFNHLPHRFRTSEANNIFIANGFKKRSVDNYIKRWISIGLLTKLEHGLYSKSSISEDSSKAA